MNGGPRARIPGCYCTDKEGRRQNPKLAALAKIGRLKLNISNVALEAGRSRTPIATKESPFQAVRDAVYGQDRTESSPEFTPLNTQSVQTHLMLSKNEAKEARNALRIVATKLVAVEKEKRELQVKLDSADAKIERLLKLIN